MHDDPAAAQRQVIERHRAVLSDAAVELAQGAIARGSGAIYAGCTLWTGDDARRTSARELGVPVIDPGQASVLMAAAAARARRGVLDRVVA